jgi:hypothetical protein
MTSTRRLISPIAAGAAVILAGAVLTPAAAGAATAKSIPVVQAHMGKATTLSRTHLNPGRVTFAVHSTGDHTLQIAILHKGYTLAQANQDINAGFEGSAAAITRVDRNVTFKGGSEAKPGKPSRLTVYLSAGHFLAINFDTGAYKAFTVSGKTVNRKTPSTNSHITMLTYGFDVKSRIHRQGTMRLTNRSDQPHFLVMQHIKRGTTSAQLKKAFASDSSTQPKFLLKAGTDTGVLSDTKTQAFTYKLPAGTYVIACFWPDDETGMEHAAMGMFKIITLY